MFSLLYLDGDRIMTTEGFLALNEVFHQVISLIGQISDQ